MQTCAYSQLELYVGQTCIQHMRNIGCCHYNLKFIPDFKHDPTTHRDPAVHDMTLYDLTALWRMVSDLGHTTHAVRHMDQFLVRVCVYIHTHVYMLYTYKCSTRHMACDERCIDDGVWHVIYDLCSMICSM